MKKESDFAASTPWRHVWIPVRYWGECRTSVTLPRILVLRINVLSSASLPTQATAYVSHPGFLYT